MDSNGNILNVRAMPSHTRESKLIYLCETVENQNSKRGRWTCRRYDEWRQPPPFEPPVARASKKARSLLSRLRHAEHPTTWASRATSAMDVACLSLSRRSKKRLWAKTPACRWSECARCDTLSHKVMWAQSQMCRERDSCVVYLSTVRSMLRVRLMRTVCAQIFLSSLFLLWVVEGTTPASWSHFVTSLWYWTWRWTWSKSHAVSSCYSYLSSQRVLWWWCRRRNASRTWNDTRYKNCPCCR